MNKPLLWVPSLYFMQGIPYALVIIVAEILLKQFHFSNSEITFYTSLFILPWVFKFLFAPFFEHRATKRSLTLVHEFFLSLITGIIALLLYFHLLHAIVFLFFIMALFSSWHDICSDGLYLIALNRQQQINYVAIRTLAYQFARLMSQGGVVVIIGYLTQFFALNLAWCYGFTFLFIIMFLLTNYHRKTLPQSEGSKLFETEYTNTFVIFKEFFAQTHIIHIVLFLFIFNIAEAQLIKIVPLFLLDSHAAGGMNLTIEAVGFIYGTLGMIAMLLGITVSSQLIRHFSLKKCLNGTSALLLFSQFGYIMLSSYVSLNKVGIICIIVLTQFCFGLSNNAYMIAILDLVREKKFSMSFYAIATGIMAFGMLLPGAISGYIQQHIGYFNFFIWIIALQILVLFYTRFVISFFINEHPIS